MTNEYYGKDVPLGARKVIDSLSAEGKAALVSIFDTESDFAKHVNLTNFINDFFADDSKYPDLYHYTNENGVKGILTSHQIQITSQYYMNDPKENIYVTDLALDYLRKDDRLNKKDLEVFEQSFHQIIFDIYVWSFTNNDYSQVLFNPEYGDFALHFKNNELQKDLDIDLNGKYKGLYDLPYGKNFIFPLKVEYSLTKQQEYVDTIMKTWKNAYLSFKHDRFNVGMDNIMKACYPALTLCSLCFKNPILNKEEEIRFITIRNSNDKNACHPDLTINGKPKIVYEFNPKLLRDITYSKQAKHISEIRKLMDKTGFQNINLKPTALPY